MSEETPNYFQQLRQLIDTSHNLSEIKALCFDLGIDYEHLAGDEKLGKINALLLYVTQRDQLDELLVQLRARREHLEWPDIPLYSRLLEDKDEFALESGLEEPGDIYREVRRGGKLLWGVIVLSVTSVLFLLLLLFVIRPDIPVRIGLLRPKPMPAGLNVVVAGFAMEQDGNIVRGDVAADNMNGIVSAALKELAIIDNVRDRNDPGVDYVIGNDQSSRERQADQLAKLHNADIVIYGIVRDLGVQTEFTPEFYIAPAFAATQPELITSDFFGEPLVVVQGWDESDALSDRIEILRLFLNGLVAFISEDYEEAQSLFEEAASKHPEPGIEALYILAGNAASLRNAFEEAFHLYSKSLETRPEYARGLLGRGSGFFQIAGQIRRETEPAYDPEIHLPEGARCIDQIPLDQVEILIQMAETCYREAAASPDHPPTADIEIKVPYQLGLLYSWRAQFGFGDYWDETEQSMTQVLAMYEAADEDRQLRLIVQAARAHETLADRLVALESDDPDSVTRAVEHYQQAILLLDQSVNQGRANKRIEFIRSKIEGLENTEPTETAQLISPWTSW